MPLPLRTVTFDISQFTGAEFAVGDTFLRITPATSAVVDGHIVPAITVSFDPDAAGQGTFQATPGDLGSPEFDYRAELHRRIDGGVDPYQKLDLGQFRVPDTAGPFSLGVLIASGIPPAPTTYWRSITEAEYDAALDAADRAEAAAIEAALYDGPKVDTFAELASVTPAMLAVGGYIRVVSLGAVYQRVGSGGHLNYSGSGGVRLNAVVAPDVRAFGALCDGVTNDTAVIQLAATIGDLTFPAAMTTLITDTITFPQNTFRTITQRGIAFQTVLFSPATARPAFAASRTAPELGRLTVQNVWIDTDVAACGTAFRIEEVRPETGQQVVGADDFLVMSNVSTDGAGDGYWTKAIHAVNAGGVNLSQVQFRNNNNTVAQLNAATKAIHIDVSQANINVIRALSVSQFYTQRFYEHITVDSNGVNVESVYVSQGEIVGGRIGFAKRGISPAAASSFEAIHFDVQEFGLFSGTSSVFQHCRIVNCDIRLGDNGGPRIANGACIKLHNGNILAIVGNGFSGHGLDELSDGVSISGLMSPTTITGNTFSLLNRGVVIPTNFLASIVGNTYAATVATKYSINADILVADEGLPSLVFVGDLNTVHAGKRAGYYVRGINATGSSNFPAGIAGGGHVLEEWVYDVNAGQQVFQVLNSRRKWARAKAGGTWSPWQIITDNTSTGWGAPTGTATRSTFATGSVTLPQLAERVKALIDDLTMQGRIGS
jgi:hypothetical protein